MYASSPVTCSRLPTSQHERFEAFLKAYYASNGPLGPVLRFALVIAGDKPATVVQSEWRCDRSPFSSEAAFIGLFDELGLATRQIPALHGWIVGHSRGRIELLPTTWETDRNSAWHRRLGVVFGYPKRDIQRFLDDADWVGPHERVEAAEVSPSDVAHTVFLCHRFEDSLAGYERAIEWGRWLRSRYHELAETWQLPILERIAERQFEIARAVYAGERAGFRGELHPVDAGVDE